MNSHAVLAEGMAAAEVGRATMPPARRPVERRRAPDLPFAIDADERNLRALLAVMAVVSLVLAVAVTIVFINQGFFWFGVAALGLSAVGVAMLVVRRMLTRSTLATGARVVSWSLLTLVLVMLIGGNRAPTLAMTALLAVLVAVPYVDGRELRRLAVAAFALTALIGLGYGLSAPPSSHSGLASESLVRFIGVLISSGLPLFAIVHVGARLTSGAQRYRDLFQRVPVGMYRSTPTGNFVDANTAFLHMFGFGEADDLAGISAGDLYADPADRARFRQAVDDAGVARRVEFRAKRRDGSIFWARDSALLVRDSLGTPLYYEGILEDVTEHKSNELKLEQRASVDSLTGLANRAVLIDTLDRMLVDASAERPTAVLFVDLNDFKQVNDRFGHASGDVLLAEAGRRLREAKRADDIAARFGGDEFAVVLAQPARRPVAEAVARRIAAAFREPFAVADGQVVVGASIGIAIADQPMASAELIERADDAMYRAKVKDKIEVFDR